MYFFYDDNISFKKSGIEHADIKRLRLFNVNADVKMSFWQCGRKFGPNRLTKNNLSVFLRAFTS